MLISFNLDTLPRAVWEQEILSPKETFMGTWYIRGCGGEHSRVGVQGRGQGDRNRASSTSAGSLYLTPQLEVKGVVERTLWQAAEPSLCEAWQCIGLVEGGWGGVCHCGWGS